MGLTDGDWSSAPNLPVLRCLDRPTAAPLGGVASEAHAGLGLARDQREDRLVAMDRTEQNRGRQLGQNHIERANRLQAVIDQLKAEHVKVQRVMRDRMTDDLWNEDRCEVCHVAWPCPTARTIGAA